MDFNKENILAFKCPRWNDLPDIDMYMDQVVSFIENRLGVFADDNGAKVITSTMINNYVKQKVIAPPVKKKYTRVQVSRLIVICLLKRCFSIGEISDMIDITLGKYRNSVAYDMFGRDIELALRKAFEPKFQPDYEDDGSPEYKTICAVLTAYSNKVYAQHVVAEYKKTSSQQKK